MLSSILYTTNTILRKENNQKDLKPVQLGSNSLARNQNGKSLKFQIGILQMEHTVKRVISSFLILATHTIELSSALSVYM